uniref:Retrotransposon protein putative n=1 Tax=Albugo laibachii Nc14 TaxID=890382 RepID=F0X1E9_9STRA|nr:retrotransposon protein putative [Albugo laibachii Nc14]|eukprot:CCA27627.1 retrotransposon protein putative [Albugo laibachii Nc14]
MVVVSQHITNVTSLLEETNISLQAAQEDPNAKGTADTKSNVRRTSGARMQSVDIRKNKIVKMVTRNQGMKTPATEIVSVMIEPDPKSHNQAMNSEEHVEWKEDADAELASLEENQTWTIVSRTNEIKALHTMWVFKRKTNADGDLEWIKARMVACGNEQVFGINFDMTFVAVIDLGTAKLILALERTWGSSTKTLILCTILVRNSAYDHMRNTSKTWRRT